MSEIPGYVKMTAGAIREKAYVKWQVKQKAWNEWRKQAIEFLLNWRKTKSKFYCSWYDIPNDGEKLLNWKNNYQTFFHPSIKIEGFPKSPNNTGHFEWEWYERTKLLSDSTEIFVNVDDARILFGE